MYKPSTSHTLSLLFLPPNFLRWLLVSSPSILEEKWRLREAKSLAQILKHGIGSGFEFTKADFRAQGLMTR